MGRDTKVNVDPDLANRMAREFELLPNEDKLNEDAFNTESLGIEVVEYGGLTPTDIDTTNFSLYDGLSPDDII